MVNQELKDEVYDLVFSDGDDMLHGELWHLNHDPFYVMDFIPELEQIASKIDAWAYKRWNMNYYLWDTKTLAAKILEDAKEECGYTAMFVRMAYFCALYLKCFAPEDIKMFVKEWYDTGKKNYNTVVHGETMFRRMYVSNLPYIASLIWIINNDNRIFKINTDMYFDISHTRSNLHHKKPSDDGLLLIDCEPDEAHKAAWGINPYLDMDNEIYEKLINEKHKKIDEIDKKLEELLYERKKIRDSHEFFE